MVPKKEKEGFKDTLGHGKMRGREMELHALGASSSQGERTDAQGLLRI